MIKSYKIMRQQEIKSKREIIVSGYSESWSKMICQWNSPRNNSLVWLMHTSSYLFNTRGIKWAVDPVMLCNQIPEVQAFTVSKDLNDLEFILLTHMHSDHIDIDLWEQLSDSACHWIVPEHMIEFFAGKTSIRRSCYSVAVPGQVITVANARITPFDAPHHEQLSTGKLNKVKSTGYFVAVNEESYLFPGDIRTYDPACLNPFRDISTVFAHVFLGRSAALEPVPPLLDAFVKFYLSCCPKKILLTHLYDFARKNPEDCWVTSHAQAVAQRFKTMDNKIEVVIPEYYKGIKL